MTISPQWADYIPSTPVDESLDVGSRAARSAESPVRTPVVAPTPGPDAFSDGSVPAEDGIAETDTQTVEAAMADGHPDIAKDRSDEDYETGAAQVGEYTAMPGMPGRGVCLLTIVAVGACAAIDLALARGITMFFDLCFVTICLVAAMSVRRRDLFTTGVLPPLVFAAMVGVVAVLSPGTFVAFGGASKAFMAGLAQHAPGLVAGYAVALLTVGSRVSASRGR